MSRTSRRSSRKAAMQTEYKVDRATMFVFYISMASILVSVLLHLSDLPAFAMQYLIFLLFEASIIVVTRVKYLQIVDPKEVNWFTIAWTSAIGAILVFVIQIVVGLLRVKLALAPWEIYLFYINAALAEECLYRATLITFLDKLLVKMPYLREQGTLRKLVLIIASASLFALSHYWVYGQDPSLMLVAFLGGITLAFVYVVARNPLPPVITHVINNLSASYQIVRGMSVVSIGATFLVPVSLPIIALAWLGIGIYFIVAWSKAKGKLFEAKPIRVM